MNFRKSAILKIVALAVISIVTSCSDFLNEELTTKRNSDYFKTQEGIRDLAVGLYYNLRFHFAYEWSYATTNYGTDEFKVGGDASNAVWNNYTGIGSVITAVNVNTAMANTLWDNMYTAINGCNLLIENAATALDDGVDKDTYVGEAHFVRAFNYLKLARQYGGVPLKLTPSVTVEREFTRAPIQEVIGQVISDFKTAYELLPATAGTGKLIKDAAAHFLAKAYLFKASEINSSWNGPTKDEDLATGLEYAEEVIAHRALAPNFADLWSYSKVDGPNETLNEIILSAQFTFDRSTRGTYGNQTHLYFLSQYLNLPQMTRDIAGGREYQRLRTTYYSYNVYDRVNDSRFWKSFKTKYAINNASGIYSNGDLGVMYIINKPDDTRFANAASLTNVIDSKTGKAVPTVFATYVGGEQYLNTNAFQNRFAPLNKYLDGTRETAADGVGYRDGILARLADTYLTAAEIYIRQEKYPEAMAHINTVRMRAAYKSGESRKAYSDGGAAYNATSNPTGFATWGLRSSFYNENSYYESNNIPETTDATNLEITDFATLPAEDEDIIATLGYSSLYDRAMTFLLNERSRELMGEFHRWEDLSRTLTLADRAKAFNDQAAPNVNDFHVLRPIPQVFLDAIQKNGIALTPDEKQEIQNSGY